MPKKDIQIVICGRGGQGILFLTKLIDEVALIHGNNVISSETHGMAMRGGSVVSYIRIGKFDSPLIRSEQADIVIALSEHELELNRHLLKTTGAQIYVNSPDNKDGALDAEKISRELGASVVTNLVMLGFACAHKGFPFSFESVLETLKAISPPRMKEINAKAFTHAYNHAKR